MATTEAVVVVVVAVVAVMVVNSGGLVVVVDWWWRRRRRRRPGDGVAHSPIFVRTRDVRELALGAEVVGQRVQCSRPAAPA